MNNKGIIYRLIFEQGCSVFLIAKKLKTSEAQIYRCLNGEDFPPGAEDKLKMLWLDLVELDKVPKRQETLGEKLNK